MHRGEVWWATLNPPAGRRPVLVVTREDACRVRDSVTVVPLTTKVREIPSYVLLGPENGLPRRCAANCDDLVTIPKGNLNTRITELDSTQMAAVESAVRFALAL